MKLRDKFLYMSFGAGLVVLGMVLNSFLIDDADAQIWREAIFKTITCESLIIKDGDKRRGLFGVSDEGDAMLKIYGVDGKAEVAYLGTNTTGNEMMLHLTSKSKTDKREVSMGIDRNGGRFQCMNKLGENVVRIGVGDNGRGGLDLRDKYGYK